MSARPFTLVCFAVKEEARSFNELAASRPDVKTLLTGIGPRNAEQSIRAAITARKPALVLSCGFAGGLRPGLASGAVVFSTDRESGLEPALLAAGAQPAKVYFVAEGGTTAEEKRTPLDGDNSAARENG